MVAKESVGVAVSSSQLTLVYAKASPFRTRLRAHAAFDLDPHADHAERIGTARALVRSFWRQHRIGDASLWIGLPADQVIQRVIYLPSAARENLDKAIEYELQKYVPLDLEHLHLQYEVLHEDRGERRLTISVAAVKKSDLAPLIEARDDFRAGISGVQSAATAAINGLWWAAKPIPEKTCALAYVADRTLHLAYFEDDQPRYLWALAVDDDVPAQLQQLGQRLEELGAVGPDDRSKSPFRVYCHGPEANESFLREWRQAPGLEFCRLELQEELPEGLNSVVGAGLAVKGLEDTALDLNLFPAPFRKKPSVVSRFVGAALVVLALATGLAWAGSHFLYPRIQDGRVEKELSELSGQIEALQKVKADAEALQGQIDYLQSLRQERMDPLGFLKELTELVPDTAWLLALSVAGDKAAIQGVAENSTDLIPELEASPHFSNAQFTATITKSRDGKDVFRIGFDIEH